MVSKETCYKIWHCYSEIEKSEKLMSDMLESYKKTETLDLTDSFGNKKGLMLGVPTGSDGHRLYNIPPDLCVKVIEAHKENMLAELKKFEAIVKVEMSQPL